MDIRIATEEYLDDCLALAMKLWPDGEPCERMDALLKDIRSEDWACLLCQDGDRAVGFAELSLRRDYVEGCDGSPVGYLEGVYVLPEYRRQGVAKALLAFAEQWVAGKGCTQMASDCELTNGDSLRFHLGSGFTEANRIICFVKDIDPPSGKA